MPLTTAEEMAIAVLKGDIGAAQALADYLINDIQGRYIIAPITEIIKADIENIRCAVYLSPDIEATADGKTALAEQVSRWLNEGETLVLPSGVVRIEIYQFKDS